MDEEVVKKEIIEGVDLPEKPPVSKRKTALIDVVEDLIRSHWDNSELKKYLAAIENKDAITGSVEIDRAKAAEMLESIAIEAGLGDLFDGVLLTKVRSAVNRALKRMDYGTQQRLERKKLLEDKSKAA
jgi:hypothetical protein